MFVRMLTDTLPSGNLGSYTAAVTIVLLALMFFCLILMAKDAQLYRTSGEKVHRTNALLWSAGAAMSLFTLLFVLMRRGWLMGVVFLIGIILVYSTVGDGVRNQLTR